MNEKWYGNYRAKVVDNKDPDKFGRVLVYIPDLMPDLEETGGIWARPANNPIGGRNEDGDSEHHFMGTCYIPGKGAWTFVFFEGGNPQRPYYFGALDLENTKVLPENQIGGEYQKKWTIFKSHEGRAIVISDDPDDARVELKGKLQSPDSNTPTGDPSSVLDTDGKQSVILINEVAGKEQILIKTHKGDFINIDTEKQELNMQFKGNITIKTEGDLSFDVGGSFNRKVGMVESCLSGGARQMKASGMQNFTAEAAINIKASAIVAIDGSGIAENTGAAIPASPSAPGTPSGDRN